MCPCPACGPLPYTIHGELTADGNRIVLVAGGYHVDMRDAGKHLAMLTPLMKATEPTGGVWLPATWPAVVQLTNTFRHAWRPGPRLCEWTQSQLQYRDTPTGFLAPTIRLPAGLTPYPWQVDGAHLIAATGRVLLTDDPGTGKTITAILGLLQRHVVVPVASAFPTLVVCPASVVDPWVEAWQTWAPYTKAVAWRGQPKVRHALADTADVYVSSYDTVRMDAGPNNKKAPLLALDVRSLVIDECVPTGTSISTPNGPRPIESLCVGDVVLGVDHTTGRVTTTTVQQTFARCTNAPLVTVQGVPMTGSHPVWTSRGYVEASSVHSTDHVCHVETEGYADGTWQSDVRVVRADNNQKGQTGAILQPLVFSQMAYVQTGICRHTRYPEAERSGTTQHNSMATESQRTGHVARAFKWANQPVSSARSTYQVPQSTSGYGLAELAYNAWRERKGINQTPTDTSRTARLGDGIRSSYRPQIPLANLLQNRRSVTPIQSSDRSRRYESPIQTGQSAGCTQGRITNRAWMGSTAVHEQARAVRTGFSRGGHRVFNIETGTGNYIAGGLLVHNCHLIKTPTAVRSTAVRRIAKRANNIVALSGTPITHHPGDLWPTLVALDHDAWPSRERWVDRYCLTISGDYKDSIVGLNPAFESEFRMTLRGQHRRVAKADCLDLPPKVYSIRTVELPTDYRRAYDDMEEMMLAALPDGGEVSVMSALHQLGCLALLASAAADVTFTHDDDGTEHQHIVLKHPSWKVDALLDVLEERPGSPVVAFAPSRQLVVLAGERAAKEGLSVGYVYGKQKMADRTETVAKFQEGQLDLLCATTGAGGVGLTLTAARTVVFLQRPWSLVEALQAEDRCHRIGSERHESVDIIDIVARDTIDSRIRSVLKSKGKQLADLVQDPRIMTELLGGASVTRLRKKAS